jgi:hypothetical protein
MLNESLKKFEFDAIIKEFEVLRNEVNSRIQKQHEIVNFSIAILAGLAALSQILVNIYSLNWSNLAVFFPILSIIYSSFALMTLDNEANIALIYRYFDEISNPKMQNILNNIETPIWQWNLQRANWQHHSGLKNGYYIAMSWAKYVITIVPSIGMVISYWTIRGMSGSAWEIGLAIVSLMVVVFVFFAMAHIALLYLSLGKHKIDSVRKKPSKEQ